MEAISTPRVSCQLLQEYVKRQVMVVGKVVQLRGDSAIIDADGNVTLMLNPEAHLTPGNGVQVIGKVQDDLSIRVMNSIDLGSNVDYSAAQALVDVTHRHKEIFIFEEN
ncbi:replication factor A protein 3 [Xylariales sp. PMI_506]|nr:replication factor A protein 3 [Xylariales sp. PMI_506]